MAVIIQQCNKEYKEFLNAYIVRGVSKRAIRVIIFGFNAGHYEVDDELFILAAQYAAKNGWKNVVVKPDYIYGDSALAYNMAELTHDWDYGKLGYFLKIVVDSYNY